MIVNFLSQHFKPGKNGAAFLNYSSMWEKKDNLDNFIQKEKNIRLFLMIFEIIYSQKTCSRRNVKRNSWGRINAIIDRNLNQHEEMKSTLNRINETKYIFSHFNYSKKYWTIQNKDSGHVPCIHILRLNKNILQCTRK